MTMARPSYHVTTSCKGSDVAGEMAAAMVSGYLVFKDICGGTRFYGFTIMFCFKDKSMLLLYDFTKFISLLFYICLYIFILFPFLII